MKLLLRNLPDPDVRVHFVSGEHGVLVKGAAQSPSDRTLNGLFAETAFGVGAVYRVGPSIRLTVGSSTWDLGETGLVIYYQAEAGTATFAVWREDQDDVAEFERSYEHWLSQESWEADPIIGPPPDEDQDILAYAAALWRSPKQQTNLLRVWADAET